MRVETRVSATVDGVDEETAGASRWVEERLGNLSRYVVNGDAGHGDGGTAPGTETYWCAKQTERIENGREVYVRGGHGGA